MRRGRPRDYVYFCERDLNHVPTKFKSRTLCKQCTLLLGRNVYMSKKCVHCNKTFKNHATHSDTCTAKMRTKHSQHLQIKKPFKSLRMKPILIGSREKSAPSMQYHWHVETPSKLTKIPSLDFLISYGNRLKLDPFDAAAQLREAGNSVKNIRFVRSIVSSKSIQLLEPRIEQKSKSSDELLKRFIHKPEVNIEEKTMLPPLQQAFAAA